MKYLEYLEKAKASTNEDAVHQKQQLVVLIFRKLGIYTAPLFLMFNVSANKITLFGFLLGLVSSGFIWHGNVIIGTTDSSIIERNKEIDEPTVNELIVNGNIKIIRSKLCVKGKINLLMN